MTERVVYGVQVWDGERWRLVRAPKNPSGERQDGIRLLKTHAERSPERRYRLVKQTTVVEWETVS